MAPRGPKPTPTAELQRRGSRRADLAVNEPKPDPARPICPTWLRKEAKAVWKRIVPQLEAMGVLGKIDGEMLSRYCQIYAKWREAEAFLAKWGDTYDIVETEEVGRKKVETLKDVRQYPQVNTAIKLAEQLTRIEQQFGMSPSSRAALGRILPAAPPTIKPKPNDKEKQSAKMTVQQFLDAANN